MIQVKLPLNQVILPFIQRDCFVPRNDETTNPAWARLTANNYSLLTINY